MTQRVLNAFEAAHTTTEPAAMDFDAWLSRQDSQDQLRFMTCGSVDDGKSTLIGRMLWESHQILDDQLIRLKSESKRYGTQGDEPDFALLVDGLAAEREQGITIDVAFRYYSTASRRFIVADSPGHEQYTRNMITAASTSELAIVLVDARKGIVTQTRRHACLVSLMGIGHVVLAVNKMDLVDWDQEVFRTIEAEFRELAVSEGFDSITAVPVCALRGDNISGRSPSTPWYSGPTLAGFLETVEVIPQNDKRVVFPVQWVNRTTPDYRGYSGTLAGGRLEPGDELRVSASGQLARVRRLSDFDGELQHASAGDAVTIELDRELDISRGDILSAASAPLETSDQFEATVIWMHADTGHTGRNYELKLANQWVGASMTAIKHRIDVNTGHSESCRQLELNDIAVCNLALSKPIVMDAFSASPELGRFILVDRFTSATVAAGLIHHSLRRASNIHRHARTVSRQDRERLNGHSGRVLWFTGLSGSGKSTIANALDKRLNGQGVRTILLDGDNIRHGLNRDLGFTDADRVENIRRVAEVARLMVEAGLVVLVALISPFRSERQMVREMFGPGEFVEIFVDTPLEIAEARDPKGLYKKARSGEIPNFTGVNAPYEAPLTPDVKLDAGQETVEDCVDRIEQHLKVCNQK